MRKIYSLKDVKIVEANLAEVLREMVGNPKGEFMVKFYGKTETAKCNMIGLTLVIPEKVESGLVGVAFVHNNPHNITSRLYRPNRLPNVKELYDDLAMSGRLRGLKVTNRWLYTFDGETRLLERMFRAKHEMGTKVYSVY